MHSRPLRVLFGNVDQSMPGGVGAAEHAFEEACARSGRVVVLTLPFGRRDTGMRGFGRSLQLIRDLIDYAGRVLCDRPDIVHLNTGYDRRALVRDVGYSLVSRLLGQTLFLKYHGSEADLALTPGLLWKWMTRAVLGGASGVGLLSSEEKRNFAAAGWPAEKFHVVKNAVDCERFAEATWPRSSVPELLFIARFVPAKGLADTIRAVRILADQGRTLTLCCVGDGPARSEAEALASELGLAGIVHFTGRLTETEASGYYLRASVLVFPTSHSEGFSMTLFQSLAAGLPIVTTKIRAAADWLEEPTHCLWVRPNDPEHLAEKIAWLLDRPAEAARMSIAARARARLFAPDIVAAEYVRLYEVLLAC